MMNSKFYDELKKKQKSILPEKKLKSQIIDGACYCSGMLDRDDPLYGACEAAFRRGFMHGADMVTRLLFSKESGRAVFRAKTFSLRRKSTRSR